MIEVGPAPLSRRSTERARRWVRFSVVAAGFALCISAAVIVVLYLGYRRWEHALEDGLTRASDDEADVQTKHTNHADEPSGDDSADAPTDSKRGRPAPDDTEVRRVGLIEVVDIGVSAPTLRDALEHEHEEAERLGQTVLVMLTSRRCSPCRGFDGTLEDPLMQTALNAVRLVRVDLDVFDEELSDLGIPHDVYPAFFLFRAGLHPRDHIHGGEWDDDIARNIAPVLGAFVQGSYHERRHELPPTTDGIQL